MKNETLSNSIQWKLSRSISLIAVVTTLAVTPSLSYEPINWIKMLVLSMGAFGCFLIIISANGLRLFSMNSNKLAINLLMLLFFGSLLSWIVRSDKSSVFWGTSGRATGFLTYLSLILFCLTALLTSSDSLARITMRHFIACGYMVVAYMTLQHFGLDPIPWSGNDTFGTLGNINFSSAFVGMWMAAALVYLSDAIKSRKKISFFLLLLILWAGYLVFSSGSFQGLLGFALFATLIFPKLITSLKMSLGVLGVYFILVCSALLTLIYATTQRNFAGGYFFQDTMAYRRDYWVAAKNMIVSNPFLGVGFDQYGLFYRSSRDATAAFRTNVNRVSDSAHSVFLDIGASVGALFAIVFLLLIILAVRSSVNIIRIEQNKYWLSIAGVWVAYLPQLLIGINQIGVGVWAWAIMGTLLGFKVRDNQVDSVKRKQTVEVSRELPAKSAMAGIIGAVLGLLLSIPPLISDSNYKSASEKGDLTEMREIAFGFGGNRFLAERTLEFSTKFGDGSLSLQIAEQLVARYPRSDYAWRVIYDLVVTPDIQRRIAKQRVRDLDPYLYQEYIKSKSD